MKQYYLNYHFLRIFFYLMLLLTFVVFIFQEWEIISYPPGNTDQQVSKK